MSKHFLSSLTGISGHWAGWPLFSGSPGTKHIKGNIGTKEYGCTITNTGGITGCNYYSWIGDYFPDASDFEYGSTGNTIFQWGWIYRAGDNGTWINANSGGEGDITGS